MQIFYLRPKPQHWRQIKELSLPLFSFPVGYVGRNAFSRSEQIFLFPVANQTSPMWSLLSHAYSHNSFIYSKVMHHTKFVLRTADPVVAISCIFCINFGWRIFYRLFSRTKVLGFQHAAFTWCTCGMNSVHFSIVFSFLLISFSPRLPLPQAWAPSWHSI